MLRSLTAAIFATLVACTLIQQAPTQNDVKTVPTITATISDTTADTNAPTISEKVKNVGIAYWQTAKNNKPIVIPAVIVVIGLVVLVVAWKRRKQ